MKNAIKKERKKVRKHIFLLAGEVLLCCLIFNGCVLLGIKQLGRNNMTEEEIAARIVPCQTTRNEVIRLYRKPSDDFFRKQGDYDVYIYKGFSGRVKFEEQTLEVLINSDDLVVNYRLNDPGLEPLEDKCLGAY